MANFGESEALENYRVAYSPPRKLLKGHTAVLFSQNSPISLSKQQPSIEIKLHKICSSVCDWLNSFKKQNFRIEDVSMNLILLNSPNIWVSVLKDHSTKRHYDAHKKWYYKLFGKTSTISDKNFGYSKAALVMKDFLSWNATLPPNTSVIKSLAHSPYSSYVFALYQK